MATPYTLTARWLFPVDQPPLARGTITIQDDKIVAVDQAGTRTADIDLGNAAILPGFTNAHTHLDLSDALGRCPPTPDFTEWLCAIVAHRRGQTPQDVAKAIDIGLSQCLRHGTTLLGDIAAGGASWDRLAGAPLRATVFHEVIGLSEQRAGAAIDQIAQWISSPDTGTCVRGVSPHAPYSVGESLFGWVAECTQHGPWDPAPRSVAIHLAESMAEVQLLEERTGPFVRFLSDLGAWDERGLVAGIQRIVQLFEHNVLFIHGNYLTPTTLPGYLIYCPRTHAAFGHAPHPFRQFMARGTRVAIATDSLASNPDLDMLAEARFLHERFPDLLSSAVLAMATLDGASALGWENVTGSLKKDKSADFVVLPLPNEYAADPHELVLRSALQIKAVVFRGKLAYATDASVALP